MKSQGQKGEMGQQGIQGTIGFPGGEIIEIRNHSSMCIFMHINISCELCYRRTWT